MADLSDKFGALMARMAQTDAELFRTIGDHNKAVTEQVMDLTTEEPNSAGPLAITPPPLLPSEERSEAALKGRFKTCKAAFEWIEQKLGPPPNKKKSWSIAVQTVTSGRWEIQATHSKGSSASHSQITRSLQQINQRLDGIELVLAVILKALEEKGTQP